MLSRAYIRRHVTSIAIIIFIIAYALVVVMKPSFMYNNDGSLRQFGVGYSNRTVIPAWLISIVIAISSYFAVLYYLASPRLDY
jgi:hypothetical protein